MEITKTSWLEDFHETCQNIQEDTLLLEALSAYADDGIRNEYFPQTLCRLCDYLSQHAAELHRLEKRLGPDSTMKSGP